MPFITGILYCYTKNRDLNEKFIESPEKVRNNKIDMNRVKVAHKNAITYDIYIRIYMF